MSPAMISSAFVIEREVSGIENVIPGDGRPAVSSGLLHRLERQNVVPDVIQGIEDDLVDAGRLINALSMTRLSGSTQPGIADSKRYCARSPSSSRWARGTPRCSAEPSAQYWPSVADHPVSLWPSVGHCPDTSIAWVILIPVPW
jgi:hypothetical protein